MPSDKDNKVWLIVSAELSVGITIDRRAGIYIGNPDWLWLSIYIIYINIDWVKKMCPEIIKNRSILKVSGNDSESFLQGLITNDVSRAKTELIYTALL